MRLKFEHPAVVTGTWENGNVRRELVRASADFEIAEYSSMEAPLTFTVRDRSTKETKATIRTVANCHYKRWTWDEPSCCFGSDAVLMQSLYTGKNLAFKPIRDLVYTEVARVEKLGDYRGIENTERRPLKREIKDGLDSLSVSCMKAPILKNWQWLGPDVQAEVAMWKESVEAVLARIILVDGVPYTRSFEPCYTITHADVLVRRHRGLGSISASTAAVYSQEPDRTSVDPATGLADMRREATLLGTQFFSATDLSEAERFSRESGWGDDGERKSEIIVHDEAAVSTDFLEMETVRHARMLHDRAGKMIRALRHSEGADFYCDQPVDAAGMRSQIESMRSALLSWQKERNGTDDLSAPFEGLLEHILHWGGAQRTKISFDLEDQMNAFKVREDMSPVTVAAFLTSSPP